MLQSAFMPSTESKPPNLIHELPTITERLDVGQMFPTAQPLEVELG